MWKKATKNISRTREIPFYPHPRSPVFAASEYKCLFSVSVCFFRIFDFYSVNIFLFIFSSDFFSPLVRKTQPKNLSKWMLHRFCLYNTNGFFFAQNALFSDGKSLLRMVLFLLFLLLLLLLPLPCFLYKKTEKSVEKTPKRSIHSIRTCVNVSKCALFYQN